MAAVTGRKMFTCVVLELKSKSAEVTLCCQVKVHSALFCRGTASHSRRLNPQQHQCENNNNVRRSNLTLIRVVTNHK
jgi:hypothetical protein